MKVQSSNRGLEKVDQRVALTNTPIPLFYTSLSIVSK